MSRPVAAVVVHWQDPEDTLGCVASLADEPGVSIVVVDNGSHESVGHLLARRAPLVECLRSEENLGYAGGANLGIRHALAQGAEIVLLLNNDARVRPGATAAARAVLDTDPAIAGSVPSTARAATVAPGCTRASLLSSSTISAPCASACRIPRLAPPA